MSFPYTELGGSYGAELEAAEAAARAAATVLAADFARAEGPRGSRDKSPADTEAERIIRELLTSEFPEYGFQAEEEDELDREPRDPHRHVWLVDPNDGTSHYLRGARGAAVSIALLRRDLPVLGVVLAHTSLHGGHDVVTWAEGCGPLRRNGVPVEPPPARRRLEHGDVVLAAPSAEKAVIEIAEVVAPARFRSCPSIAYRLALVAAGDAVATLSVNAPGALDYAAGHALLRGVGGTLVDGRGVAVRYGGAGRSTPAVFGGPPGIARELASRHWSGVIARRRLPAPELCHPRPGRCVRDDALLRRAQGALVGQLAGDALGGQVEFLSPRDVAAAHPDGVRDLRDGGHWRTLAGQPTDDSELALALARVLIERGWNPGQVAAAYARWFGSEPFDCDPMTARALATAWRAIESGAAPGIAAEVASAAAAMESKGVCALVRVSPLALLGWDRSPQELARWARDDARITHPNRVCQDASAVLACAVAFALRSGAEPLAVYEHAVEVASRLGMDAEIVSALRAARTEPPRLAPNIGLVATTLQNAFFQLVHARSFEDALVETVGGGDADTHAAIVGALLGAVHGIHAIPLRWRNAILSCRPMKGVLGVKQPRPSAYWPVDALVVAERLVARDPSAARRG